MKRLGVILACLLVGPLVILAAGCMGAAVACVGLARVVVDVAVGPRG